MIEATVVMVTCQADYTISRHRTQGAAKRALHARLVKFTREVVSNPYVGGSNFSYRLGDAHGRVVGDETRHRQLQEELAKLRDLAQQTLSAQLSILGVGRTHARD